MPKEKLYSGTVSQTVIRTLKQLRDACSWPVTKVELDLDSFGKSLKTLREDCDISQKDMARRIGVSPAFLSDCESGNRRLGLAEQIKFVKECKP